MTYRISKEWQFSAAHHLPTLPDGHKCRRPHGHNYTVNVELASKRLDRNAMVRDYADLDPLRAETMRLFDHQYLNGLEWEGSFMPTAEALAAAIFAMGKDLGLPMRAVTVCETANTSATYEEDEE